MLPTKFHITWPSGFRGKAARNRPIRNKNCLWWPCLLTDQNGMSNSYEGLPQMLPTTFQSIWPSCFRVEDFQKSTNQKQELPVVAMFVNGSGPNEQSLQRTCHRCFLPSFSSFGQAVSEQKFLKIGRSETRNLQRGPSIDSSYQVSLHLTEGFQRRRLKCEKLTDDRRQVMAKAHIAFGKVI